MLPWLASNSSSTSGNEQAPGQATIGVECLVNRVAKSCSYIEYKGMHGVYIIQLYLLICMHEVDVDLVDACCCMCIFYISPLEPACIISSACSRIFAMHI